MTKTNDMSLAELNRRMIERGEEALREFGEQGKKQLITFERAHAAQIQLDALKEQRRKRVK